MKIELIESSINDKRKDIKRNQVYRTLTEQAKLVFPNEFGKETNF